MNAVEILAEAMLSQLSELPIYKVAHCSLCDVDMIICPTCGNNTCNGGYGTVGDKLCTDCPKAYEEDKRMFGDKDMT